MDFALNDDQLAIRDAVRDVCNKFPSEYWRRLETTGAYPSEFVDTFTQLGWLSILIPEEYGGGGLGITEASIVLEEIHRSGGNANACHAQMYTMGALIRHGSDEQKQRYLPEIAASSLRLQAFGVTEPDAGSDSTRINTRAVRRGDCYLVNGQKIYISRVEQSDLMLLLVRTTPADEVEDRTKGLSLLLIDLRRAGWNIEARRIPMMFNHHTYQVFITDLEVPVENLIGEEDNGFRHIIDGWNAERCLIASEAIGDARFFLERASQYARERRVFDRPIGMNQGVQFPLAQALAATEAASLVRYQAATLFDAQRPCGTEADMAKLLASQAASQAGNAALLTFGGNGLAVEYDVERKFRETRLFEIAPINNNLVLAHLAQRALRLPRSY